MEITKATYLLSSPSFNKCPDPDRAEFAFIGRSNVGKSSLINMLCNNTSLAKTSASPGKTQMINHFDIVSRSKKVKEPFKWYLVDLPGYGYAKVSQSSRRMWEQMIEGYLRKRENLVSVFVLVDARHEPQKKDLEFMQQLGDWEVPFAVIFTKSDKEKPGVVKRNVEAMATLMREHWQFLPPFFVTSSTKKGGKQDVLDYLEQCLTTEPED